GEALGASENAAQKRVARALEELRVLLQHRGVVLSATALAAALTVEAVCAAPAALAAGITATALAGATTGGGATLSILKIMTMTKLKAGIISAVVVTGGATPILWRQYLAQEKLRHENGALRRQLDAMAEMQSENARLSNLLTRADDVPPRSLNTPEELLRLRSEVTRLKADARTNSQPDPGPADPFVVKTSEIEKRRNQAYGKVLLGQYSKLFADLGLTPEQSAALEELILRKLPANTYLSSTIMPGDTNSNRATLEQQARAEQGAINEQIRRFLG